VVLLLHIECPAAPWLLFIALANGAEHPVYCSMPHPQMAAMQAIRTRGDLVCQGTGRLLDRLGRPMQLWSFDQRGRPRAGGPSPVVAAPSPERPLAAHGGIGVCRRMAGGCRQRGNGRNATSPCDRFGGPGENSPWTRGRVGDGSGVA
jgi:hypothetical protein